MSYSPKEIQFSRVAVNGNGTDMKVVRVAPAGSPRIDKKINRIVGPYNDTIAYFSETAKRAMLFEQNLDSEPPSDETTRKKLTALLLAAGATYSSLETADAMQRNLLQGTKQRKVEYRIPEPLRSVELALSVSINGASLNSFFGQGRQLNRRDMPTYLMLMSSLISADRPEVTRMLLAENAEKFATHDDFDKAVNIAGNVAAALVFLDPDRSDFAPENIRKFAPGPDRHALTKSRELLLKAGSARRVIVDVLSNPKDPDFKEISDIAGILLTQDDPAARIRSTLTLAGHDAQGLISLHRASQIPEAHQNPELYEALKSAAETTAEWSHKETGKLHVLTPDKLRGLTDKQGNKEEETEDLPALIDMARQVSGSYDDAIELDPAIVEGSGFMIPDSLRLVPARRSTDAFFLDLKYKQENEETLLSLKLDIHNPSNPFDWNVFTPPDMLPEEKKSALDVLGKAIDSVMPDTLLPEQESQPALQPGIPTEITVSNGNHTSSNGKEGLRVYNALPAELKQMIPESVRAMVKEAMRDVNGNSLRELTLPGIKNGLYGFIFVGSRKLVFKREGQVFQPVAFGTTSEIASILTRNGRN